MSDQGVRDSDHARLAQTRQFRVVQAEFTVYLRIVFSDKSMGSLEAFTEQLKPVDMGVATTTLPDPVQFLEANGTVSAND